MKRFVKHVVLLLAVLSVGAAQVFGIGRGYLCECFGAPVHVSGANCGAAGCHTDAAHDEHGEHHHSDDGDGDDDSDGEGGNGGSGKHEHRELKESLKLVPFTPLALDLPAVIEADLSAVFAGSLQLARALEEHRAELKPPDDTGGPPPASVLVARTMVLLV
jgi:hypothetical protein